MASDISNISHNPVPVTLQAQSLKSPLPVTVIDQTLKNPVPVTISGQTLKTPIPVQNTCGPDLISVWALIAAGFAILVALRQAHLAKKDLKTGLEALRIQLEELKPKPSFEFRANGETQLLKARRESPINIELFIVNSGNGPAQAPLSFEVAIPEELNVTGSGNGLILIGNSELGRIPGYPGQYRIISTVSVGRLESDTAAFLGTLDNTYVPKGRFFLLCRVIENQKRHAYSRVVVECDYP